MESARLLSSLKILLVYIAAVGAFSPNANSEHGHVYRSALCSVQASKDAGDRGSVKMPQRSEFIAMLGSFVTGAIVSSVEPAHAAVTANPSSSLYLSEEIKTFDMSLPSYDSINTLKADEKALGIEDAPEPSQKNIKKPKKKAEATSGGNNPMGSILPSMNKSGPSKKSKPPKGEGKKERKPEKAAPKEEYETMDFALPSYSESAGTKEKSIFAL